MSSSLKLYFSLLCAITIHGCIIGVQNNHNLQNNFNTQDTEDIHRNLVSQVMLESLEQAMNYPGRIVNLGLFHSSSVVHDRLAQQNIAEHVRRIPGSTLFNFSTRFDQTEIQGVKKMLLLAVRKPNA